LNVNPEYVIPVHRSQVPCDGSHRDAGDVREAAAGFDRRSLRVQRVSDALQRPPRAWLPDAPALRVVLDTNVLVGILAYSDPLLETIRSAWRNHTLLPLIDDPLFEELERVRGYSRLARRWSAEATDEYLRVAVPVSAANESARCLPRCEDPDDQKLLALAARGGAHALVTADKAVLALAPRVPFAVEPPASFVARICGCGARYRDAIVKSRGRS